MKGVRMQPEPIEQGPSKEIASSDLQSPPPQNPHTQGVYRRLRGKWRALASAAVVLAGGAVAAGVTGSITDGVRSFVKWTTGQIGDVFPPALPRADPAAALSILVVRLEGDGDGTQSERISTSLLHAFGGNEKSQQIDVLLTSRMLTQDESGSVAANLKTTEARGRDWLTQSGADVLIWGRVAKKDEVFRIYFLNKYAASPTSNPRGTYLTTPQLILSTDFNRDLGLAIAGMAAAIAAPAKQGRQFAADVLDTLYPRLQRLADLQPSTGGRAYCDVKFATAQVADTLGSQKGDAGRLREAIDAAQSIVAASLCSEDKDFALSAQLLLGTAQVHLGFLESGTSRLQSAVVTFRNALNGMERDRSPLYWATAKVGLANALMGLGELSGDIAQLRDAVTACREALSVLVRKRDGQMWASAQGTLGVTLMMAAFVTGEIDQLNDAVGAFRDVLEDTKRDDAPALWAVAQIGLGTAMAGQADDVANLKDAIATIRAGLEEFTRQRTPYQWAAAQGTLGSAFMRLYGFDNEVSNLKNAAFAFQEALSVLTRARAPRQWAQMNGALGQVHLYLGGRQGGAELLVQAVADFHAALTEPAVNVTGFHALSRATIQSYLGYSLLRLGEWEVGTTRLTDASDAYREALQVWTREKTPADWSNAQRDFGRALQLIGERKGDQSHLQASVVAYGEALKELTQERDPLGWASTQGDLGMTLIDLGNEAQGTALLTEAIAAMRKQLPDLSRERDPLGWAQVQAYLGQGLLRLAAPDTDTVRLEQAIDALRASLEVMTAVNAPLDWPAVQVNLGDALLQLGERRKDVASAQASAMAYKEVLGLSDKSSYQEAARTGLAKVDSWLSARRKRND
jgi:tetratricopeptide (TPR) repeat protein